MPKKTSFRLTARKGTPRARGKKLQGVAPQSDLRIDKEEGYDVELNICGNDNHALLHEREEDHEAASQDSHEALPEYDHTSPKDNGKDLSVFKLILNCPWCPLVCRYRCL